MKINLSSKQKRIGKILNYFISFVILIVLIYLSLKEIDINTLTTYIISANYVWVILSVPIMLSSHWARALRWRTMLAPITTAKSTWNLFSAVMAGYAVNNIIPRGGEILRPFYYSRKEKISFTMTFATIIVERFIDLFSLLLLFLLSFYFFREQLKVALPNLHIENLLIPTFLIIVVASLSFYRNWVNFLLLRIIKPFSLKFFNRLNDLFDKFFLGLRIIKQPSQYFQLFVESLLIWFLYTLPLYFMFFSFGFVDKYNLGFDDSILLIVVSGIGYTIAPTPGAIGFYHFLVQNTLNKLYGISLEEALAFATVTHALNYFSQVIIGGIFLFHEQISLLPKIEPNSEFENDKNSPTENKESKN
ncbi:MAG: flippase-like domain-containing protein [Ignavibacteria bacterium]|nr:flippase-like domain-containing protein [Ignavibacteria bacterium]